MTATPPHPTTPASDDTTVTPEANDVAQAYPARGIRSFVMRRGHITKGQQVAYEALLPRWSLPYQTERLDFDQAFGRKAPLVLEIGFGMGETTAAIAAANPEINFLGCEVFGAGVGALLKRIDEQELSNLRIIQHDAVEVLTHMIAPGSLAGFHLYFPDPWPKKRHHKRRLVQPAWLELLVDRLQPGAYIHMATDWVPYAEHMLAVLSGNALIENTAEDYAQRPANRPLTKFERRGLKLGYEVRDLIFKKRGASV